MDRPPQFELRDNKGQVEEFTGSVNTTPILISSSVSGDIQAAYINCPQQFPVIKKLLFSVGGVDYFTLAPGEHIWLPLRGSVKGINLKSNLGDVNYELILLTEPAYEL
jgi:hypothetical protein